VARTTYHRRAGFGFADTPAARAELAFALAHGWQRAHVLCVDGRPIAFELGVLYRGTYFGRHTGFDPAFAALRPGVHLVVRVIERLCEERAAERLDLGLMDTQLKRTLGGVSEERVSLYLFGPGWRARFLRTTRALVRGAEEGARSLLGAGLARRLRRRLPG
jgi:CelD/BcsL family acetyltransferase involved in cellulose biosynthesis